MVDVSVYTNDYLEGTRALYAGRLAEAIAAFQHVTQKSPCWVMAQGNIGLALLRMNRHQEAEAHLRRVITDIDLRGCPYPPAQVQFRRNLAEAILEQGRRAESIREFAATCQTADTLMAKHPAFAAETEREKAHSLNSCSVAWLFLGQPLQAVAALNQARAIFKTNPEEERTGHAEVLTNLAVALAATDQNTQAGFALEEAIEVAQETGNYDQLFRSFVVAAKVGSNLIRPDRMLELIQEGAEEALATGRPGTAYVRYCMGVSYVLQTGGDADASRRMIRSARELENRINTLDPNIPKLRYHEALVLRLSGAPLIRITEVLIQGAHLWYKRVAVPLIPADFHAQATDLHSHFRILAACLLDVGRIEEALAAFDAGRGLSYAVDVDPLFFSRVVNQNPFFQDGGGVDLALLRQAQRTVGPDEVAVVLAAIPPRMIAFLIGRERVGYVAQETGSPGVEMEELDGKIKMLPHRLSQGVGLRAIPEVLLTFCRMVAREVGDRTISRFIPYDVLHLVPWRTLLHHCGLPWSQLEFSVGFNFLAEKCEEAGGPAAMSNAIALGHGWAGQIDLQEEAKRFAYPFANKARTVPHCTAEDIRQALEEEAIVLLSCHGKAVHLAQGLRLILELSDGSQFAEDVFPSRVAAPLVVLSACDSGVYYMAWGDYPVGAAPLLIQRGAGAVVCARFPVSARFAATFFPRLGNHLAGGMTIAAAFIRTLEGLESKGADYWQDLACLELLSGG
jgi:tetratricopeptide (TPR) repeat protein